MKTAIQELIEYANEFDFGGWEDVFIKKATELLEKEKQQIINTYWDAYKEGQISSDVTADEYYNQNYKNNE